MTEMLSPNLKNAPHNFDKCHGTFVSHDFESQMFIMICCNYSEGNFYRHSDPFKVVIVPWCINIACVIRLMHYKWGRECLSQKMKWQFVESQLD